MEFPCSHAATWGGKATTDRPSTGKTSVSHYNLPIPNPQLFSCAMSQGSAEGADLKQLYSNVYVPVASLGLTEREGASS